MSKKIRVVFYRAKTGDGHWLDNAINTWTWLISAKNRKVGPYSHVEIWTPDDRVFMMDGYRPVGEMWTSTMRGENNGTVSRPANTVIENAERWDYCEIELSEGDYECLIEEMKRNVKENKGYSKRDLWRFFLPFHRNDKSRDICSEFVNDNLYVIGVVNAMDIPSPRRLAWKLKQAGYEIKPLKEIE